MLPPHVASGLSERDDVVAAHEGDGSFCFDGLDHCVSRVRVGPELFIPDMAGALMIDDFEGPSLVGLKAIDFDREGVAVHDDVLALLLAADNRGDRDDQPGMGIDRVQFAGFDHRGNDDPVPMRPRACSRPMRSRLISLPKISFKTSLVIGWWQSHCSQQGEDAFTILVMVRDSNFDGAGS